MGKYTDEQNLSIAMKQHPPEGTGNKIDEIIYDFPSIFELGVRTIFRTN